MSNATVVGAPNIIDPSLLFHALLPQLGISIVQWSQVIFSLNKFRHIYHINKYEYFALCLYIAAAFVRVVSGATGVMDYFFMQVASSVIASTLAFSGFIIIFNNSLTLPSRQQGISIVLIGITTTLWTVHNTIFLNVKTEYDTAYRKAPAIDA